MTGSRATRRAVYSPYTVGLYDKSAWRSTARPARRQDNQIGPKSYPNPIMSPYLLIVDDDPDAREILQLVLGTLEIEMRQAPNGREALQCIKKQRPLLMVLDMTMPELDGPGLLRTLRDTVYNDTDNLPVIVFTAMNTDDKLADALKIPADRLMRKGSTSMTHLRKLVIDILGEAVPVDRDFL